mmetsp:Transcript_46880/g.136410  ORF Transcript_46880/g.136410 Transcript_46880/m.136410 type:complete len:235 (+) Transcript_46880:1460-2164(+)
MACCNSRISAPKRSSIDEMRPDRSLCPASRDAKWSLRASCNRSMSCLWSAARSACLDSSAANWSWTCACLETLSWSSAHLRSILVARSACSRSRPCTFSCKAACAVSRSVWCFSKNVFKASTRMACWWAKASIRASTSCVVGYVVLSAATSCLTAARSRMKAAVCSRMSLSWVWCTSRSFWSMDMICFSHSACLFAATPSSAQRPSSTETPLGPASPRAPRPAGEPGRDPCAPP